MTPLHTIGPARAASGTFPFHGHRTMGARQEGEELLQGITAPRSLGELVRAVTRAKNRIVTEPERA